MAVCETQRTPVSYPQDLRRLPFVMVRRNDMSVVGPLSAMAKGGSEDHGWRDQA